MVSGGVTRIQESLGDTIKIWSAEEWSKEVARRIEEDKLAPKDNKIEKKIVDEEDVDSLIQEDTEDDGDTEEVVKPTKPKGKGRKKL